MKKILILCLSIALFCACSKDDEPVVQPVQNSSLLKVLSNLGFETKNNSIVKNDKLMNTSYLNLSNANIESIDGLEAFENLEVLNLANNSVKTINLSDFPKLKELNVAKNPNLTEIKGLDQYETSNLEKLILPYKLRHEFGALPLFVKKRSEKDSKFSAQIEDNMYGDELRDYTYYYVFKNVNVANYIFRALGEDSFIIVDYKGEKTTALDMSEKIKAVEGKEYNLIVKADRVVSYEDVEILINNGFKFSDFPLKGFELSTEIGTSIKPFDKLDFSGYKVLESVKIDQIPVKEVNFAGCSNLKSVEIGNSAFQGSAVRINPLLTTLSLEDSPLLELLNANAMSTLKSITVHKDAPIKNLHLTDLGASKINNLNTSHIEHIRLENLEISEMNLKSENLKSVYVVNTKIPTLDFSMAKKLSGDIIIGENRSLTAVTFPTAQDQESNKIQVYRNNITRLDLSMYKRIDVLGGVVWTGKTYKEKDGEKGAEEGLQELVLNVENLISNLPASPGTDWDGSNKPSMKVYFDVDFLRTSTSLKQLFENGGTDKTKPYAKLYKYGYKWGEYRNIGVVKAADFE